MSRFTPNETLVIVTILAAALWVVFQLSLGNPLAATITGTGAVCLTLVGIVAAYTAAAAWSEKKFNVKEE